MIQAFLLKLGLGAAALAAVAGITWGAADAHYSRQYVSLKTAYEQQAKDQAARVAQIQAADAAAAKAIDDEAQTQIGGMARVISDLSVRSATGHNAVHLPACPASPAVAAVQSARPGTPESPPAAARAAPPAVDAAVDAAVLGDALEVGIDALRAELLFRQWVRETRQAP